jgi:L-amino acid N-acyltransferase YncA
VLVRAATPADAEAIRAIYAPVVEETAISFEHEVPSVEEMRARMTAGAPRLPWLVGASTDEVVGYAYAAPHRSRVAYRWSVETSVYVAGAARGLGVGRLLYARLLPLLSELGYISAYAGVALPNPASVALHESAGFQHVGTFPRVGHKHGRWHDTGWWWAPLDRRQRTDGRPPEPRAWDGGDPA